MSDSQVHDTRLNDEWRRDVGTAWPWLIMALVVGCAVAGWMAPLSDPDLPMHLRTAEWIVREGRVPFTEPFSWTRLGATALAGRSFYKLAVRGNLILGAVTSTDNGTATGLYRTTDGGVNFTNMSGFGTGLPAGTATHLAADPGNNARFYVHVSGNGVYRSDDSGATWVNVSAGMAAANVSQLALAVFNRNGTNAVYAAELTGTSRVYRSGNLGANWTQMDSVQANTSTTFNGFTADPLNPNLVYLSGLFVRANFPFSGRVVRGDAGQCHLDVRRRPVSAMEGGAARLPRGRVPAPSDQETLCHRSHDASG